MGWAFDWCTGLAFLLSWQWVRQLLGWLTAAMSPPFCRYSDRGMPGAQMYVGQPQFKDCLRHTMSLLTLPVLNVGLLLTCLAQPCSDLGCCRLQYEIVASLSKAPPCPASSPSACCHRSIGWTPAGACCRIRIHFAPPPSGQSMSCLHLLLLQASFGPTNVACSVCVDCLLQHASLLQAWRYIWTASAVVTPIRWPRGPPSLATTLYTPQPRLAATAP